MSGKETVWDRLTKGRKQQREEPVPTDKKGAELYTAFQDCLDQHKRHILYGVGAFTLPWSYCMKSIWPFFVGVTLSILPDIVYANWRCDEHYRLFAQHYKQTKDAMMHAQRAAAAHAASQAGGHAK